ncbi:MAG: response regulator [Magnetococcales bacterium]|nr:response regulator [Magnetococcales bacterium]
MNNELTSNRQALPKVLLVDDDPSSLFTFIAFLNGYCNVDTADNGVDAFKKMQSNHYNMVFIDIMMPQMDGLTTIKKIRAWEESDRNIKRTPIAVLTAMAFKEDKDASYCAGCDLYLTKPIERKLLLDSLHDYADCKIQISNNLEQVKGGMEKHVYDDEGNLLLNKPYIQKLVASLSPDKLFYVVDSFKSSGTSMVQQIERFAASKNMEGLIEVSHRMKGMAIHLGLEKLAGQVADIQQYAMNGDNKLIDLLVVELKPGFESSLDALNKLIFSINSSS